MKNPPAERVVLDYPLKEDVFCSTRSRDLNLAHNRLQHG